jgi:hypothetical protein
MDETPYDADPWDLRLDEDRAEHWRALLSWLDRPYSLRNLIADTPLPRDVDPQAILAVIAKGREELSELRKMGPPPEK